MKRKSPGRFGPRLTALRQSRALTQTELAKLAGISQRMVAYYELESAQPPGALLVDFARALKVSTDELLGLTADAAAREPQDGAPVEAPPAHRKSCRPPISAPCSSSSMPCSIRAGAPHHPRARNAKRVSTGGDE
jgi:transcriptional regulator with XRE-family HTH domain